MKIAFKSVLTINFTPNKNKLDYDSIKTYFQENNLLNGIGNSFVKTSDFWKRTLKEFDDLIIPFKNMIENLIQKNLRNEESLRTFLEEYV